MNFKEFADRIRMIAEPAVRDTFYNGCVNELTGRVLSKVVKKTPVSAGVFTVDPNTKKRVKVAPGGTLRQRWNAIPSAKHGKVYEGKVLNNVKYASYVEHGHRQHVGQYVPVLGKRLKKPWVPGAHMLQKSHDEVKKDAEKIVRRRFRQYLKKGFE